MEIEFSRSIKFETKPDSKSQLLARTCRNGNRERGESAGERWSASETVKGGSGGDVRDVWQGTRGNTLGRSIRVKSVGCRISCRAGRIGGLSQSLVRLLKNARYRPRGRVK